MFCRVLLRADAKDSPGRLLNSGCGTVCEGNTVVPLELAHCDLLERLWEDFCVGMHDLDSKI